MIFQDIAQLTDTIYPEDILSDWADAEVPVYNHHIIEEWTSLPNDQTDAWKEFGYDNNASIIDLMKIDLYLYYSQAFQNAWLEIKSAMNEAQELV